MIGKLQFFLWSLDAGSKIELILIDFRVKMPNFIARKNTFSLRGNFSGVIFFSFLLSFT